MNAYLDYNLDRDIQTIIKLLKEIVGRLDRLPQQSGWTLPASSPPECDHVWQCTSNTTETGYRCTKCGTQRRG